MRKHLFIRFANLKANMPPFRTSLAMPMPAAKLRSRVVAKATRNWLQKVGDLHPRLELGASEKEGGGYSTSESLPLQRLVRTAQLRVVRERRLSRAWR